MFSLLTSIIVKLTQNTIFFKLTLKKFEHTNMDFSFVINMIHTNHQVHYSYWHQKT